MYIFHLLPACMLPIINTKQTALYSRNEAIVPSTNADYILYINKLSKYD